MVATLKRSFKSKLLIKRMMKYNLFTVWANTHQFVAYNTKQYLIRLILNFLSILGLRQPRDVIVVIKAVFIAVLVRSARWLRVDHLTGGESINHSWPQCAN